ncbi:hypothetical protein ZYGR_0AD06440 [Zygosaccharomyces rouxii]|uniref:ZYRO0G20878p n=2 Tax=Zygosaccharomyces rouxii TaxID=4956 RepID=C5E1G9_ZYGRC|nr:uncharacterized protein ZYRO0G20878g [Zygosaccharomyces rouxii]KAH9202943.1 hypothetical protein LQ764DRAFT_233004 [Zygosaccharomyces rouxii]GAV51461.1 hypothetical protein ZYGR_0AD06440 [Zygosaccharomyces rouxii]CAR29953.1 ZYRO0G20878p [Zygosaccharomyces rouxii]
MSEVQPESVPEKLQDPVQEPVQEPAGENNQEHAQEHPQDDSQDNSPEPMEVDQEPDTALEADIAATDAELKEFFPQLPVSKVKKIARSDPEYLLTSNNAFVATAFATEIFVKALTEEMLAQSHLSGKNKDSKTVRLTYNDLAECVSKKNQFMFLEDVVPRTKNLRSLVKQNRVRYTTATSVAGPLAKGQTQLPFSKQDIDKSNESQRPIDVDNETVDKEEEEIDEEDDDDDMEDDEEEMRAAERVQDEQVQKQVQEIEQMNHVADLDREDSQVEQSDQEE